MSETTVDERPFRLLVTGSRHATFDEHQAVIRQQIMLAIGHIKTGEMGRVVLVHGDAPGVDEIADTPLSEVVAHALDTWKATDGPAPKDGPGYGFHGSGPVSASHGRWLGRGDPLPVKAASHDG